MLGIKFAHPDKIVVGFSGDGGSLYTIHSGALDGGALQRQREVICNNRSYKLLKLNIQQYWRERAFPSGFDIMGPDIRFDQLAQSLGIPAVRVDKPAQMGSAIDQALSHTGPFLLDVVLDSQAPNHYVHCRCGQ